MKIRHSFIIGVFGMVIILSGGCNSASKSEEGGLQALQQAAARGDANAIFEIAGKYYSGDGLPQSYTEAIRWYRLAAEKGNIHAAYNLGGFYADGRCGVQVDCAEAIKWYRLAAAKGDVAAQQQLKELRRQGQ